MLQTCGVVRQQFAFALRIVRKTAGGQHHTAPGANRVFNAIAHDHRAAHGGSTVAPRLHHQAHHGAVDANVYPRIEGRFGQARDQGVAIDQMHATAMQGHIPHITRHALGHVKE